MTAQKQTGGGGGPPDLRLALGAVLNVCFLRGIFGSGVLGLASGRRGRASLATVFGSRLPQLPRCAASRLRPPDPKRTSLRQHGRNKHRPEQRPAPGPTTPALDLQVARHSLQVVPRGQKGISWKRS